MKRSRRASTLIVTLTVLTVLSIVAGITLTRVMPRFRMAHQNAAWLEARLAAEAGVDAAMADLLRNAGGAAAGTWPGWRQDRAGGGIGSVIPGTIDTVTNLLSTLLGGGTRAAGPVAVSTPIFLDNLNVTAASGVPTEVDVQLWALQPTAAPHIRWFRIRSMATCALPPTAFQPPATLDATLRRFSLSTVRPQLRDNDVGTPMSIPTPNISRTVEVLVEPILPFELGIWADQAISLGSTGTWGVDSYDSSDAAKSEPGGLYPAGTPAKIQQNGHVASNLGRPGVSLHGPLIAANGARVRGTVATNGGDDPGTATHENVSGAVQTDPARVRDDFCREMRPVSRPSGGLVLPPPPLGLPFVTGTLLGPTQYRVTGDLDAFAISAPPVGETGGIVIMIDGDLDIHSTLAIPPNVTCILYVRGNIHFHGNAINAGNRPAQLQIYGEGQGTQHRTLQADATAAINAAFYGPRYEVTLGGNVTWCGALASRSFTVSGGGAGGVHYDESLAAFGPAISFRIARYVEDVRE